MNSPIDSLSAPQPEEVRSGAGLLSARVRRVLFDYLDRRDAGEPVTEESVLADHPELLPELAEALKHVRILSAACEEVAAGSDSTIAVRCPNCNASTKVAADSSLAAVTCSACGSAFSVIDDSPEELTRSGAFGPFELTKRLGSGAFGEVYKARDSRLDRVIALKIPRRGQLGPQNSEQFLREARAAAQLQHPSIVSVYEVGRAEDTVYIVSEFIDGPSLAEWLKRQQRVTAREAAALCQKLAAALQHAHAAGVVHRDLKPGNVLIDSVGEPHITDFGLARRETGEVTMTLEGVLVGTPAYMSPEQARGDSHSADARSDVYSLGVILFELLTGELPFRGNVRMVTQQIVGDDAPSPRKLNATVPRDLETITLKCLEKDPARRYATAKDLADDLGRFLMGEPIVARPLGRMDRAWRWCRRRPAVAGVAALIVLLGVVSATVAWREYQHRVMAVAQQGEQREQLYAADMEAAMRWWNEARVPQVEQLLDRWRPQHDAVDLRGFEWNYLWRNCQRARTSPTYDTQFYGGYGKLAYLPDKPYLVVFFGNQWRSLDAATAKLDHSVTLPVQAEVVTGHALSEDGSHAAAFGQINEQPFLRVWRLTPNLQELSLEGSASPIQQITFSPDGSLLVASSADGVVRCWSVTTGTVVHSIPVAAAGHELTINGYRENPLLAVSHDNTRLAGVTDRKNVCLWNLPESRQLQQWAVDGQMCSALAFSHDDSLLATGGWDSAVKLWRVLDGSLQRTLTGHRDWVNMVRFSPNDGRLASCGDDHTVRLWDVASGAQLDTFVGHASSLFDVAFAPDGRSVASHGGDDGLVKIWSTDGTNERAVLGTHRFIAFSIALAPDERTLASGDDVGEIRIWKFPTGEQVKSLQESERRCLQLRYSHDGRWLVAAFEGEQGIVWNATDWRISKKLPGILSTRMLATFTPDDRTLLTLGKDGLIHGWGVGAFDETMQVRTEVPNPIGLALSPDGRVLATYHNNGSLELSEFPSGKRTGTLTSDLAPINALRFSDDGRFLAVACSDATARIWDVVTQRPHGVPMRHDLNVDDVAFLPKRVVSASIDGTIRLWDLDSCRSRGVLLNPGKDSIFGVDTTADGHTIVSVHGNSNVRVWQAAAPQEVESAERLRSPAGR